MGDQLSLPLPGPELRGLPSATRRRDPSTSRKAEQAVTRSGKRTAKIQIVLEDIRKHPGTTAGEIAKRTGIDRHTVSKRTSDLVHRDEIEAGPERVCVAHGTEMLTWKVKP